MVRYPKGVGSKGFCRRAWTEWFTKCIVKAEMFNSKIITNENGLKKKVFLFENFDNFV